MRRPFPLLPLIYKKNSTVKKTLADALTRKGYDVLTPVQQAVTQQKLEGRDLLVSAQTGSGKTIGFGLAIAPTLLRNNDTFESSGAPLALVIAPTRELALQVKRELGWLYADAGAFLASCVGGMDMRDERRVLARGSHVVVATPGRLRDHILRGSIDLTQVRAVVLDEADEMLDLGFREDLEFILNETPEDRQTLMFSATVPNGIAKLAKNYQRNAERISTTNELKQHADIDYRAMLVTPRDGENAIINVLRYFEAPSAIVFCNTRAMVARLAARLSNRGFSVVALSGELTQSERSNALQAMRDGRARVCVATDVAARGIDLPNLDLVIHAELPNNHETLLHRSGRTGRAGRKGVSALIVVPSAHKKAQRIVKFAKLNVNWGSAPSADAVHECDQLRMLNAEHWQVEITDDERMQVDTLVEKFSHKQIAAAYLRQHKNRHSAPEELGTLKVGNNQPKAEFGPSVWFSVSEGRNQNASPRHLLPMLCKAGNVTKNDIGAIRIDDDLSYIEIREASVDRFLDAIGPTMKIEGSKDLLRLDSKPTHQVQNRVDTSPKLNQKVRNYKADAAPIEWNDAPKPRRKKPKPQDRKINKKTEYDSKPDRVDRDVLAPLKKGKKNKSAEKSHAKTETKAGTEAHSRSRSNVTKGPPPPKGKASSKKNRARNAEKSIRKGGNAAPKRRK